MGGLWHDSVGCGIEGRICRIWGSGRDASTSQDRPLDDPVSLSMTERGVGKRDRKGRSFGPLDNRGGCPHTSRTRGSPHASGKAGSSPGWRPVRNDNIFYASRVAQASLFHISAGEIHWEMRPWNPMFRTGCETWGIPFRVGPQGRIKVKGSGQECPLHTSLLESTRAFQNPHGLFRIRTGFLESTRLSEDEFQA